MGWIQDNSGSLIGAASSIGSSVIGAISANKQLQQQFENQKALYNQQFEQQKQLINEQNEYNSYANQRKLMEEAGLNPALMYQNGTSGALQSEVANPQVPQAPLMQGAGSIAASGIDKGIQTMMSLAQLKLLEAQAQQAEEAANKQHLESIGIGFDNNWKNINYEQNFRRGESEIDKLSSEIRKNFSDIALNSASINYRNSLTNMTKYQIDEILSNISLNDRKRINMELEAEGIPLQNQYIAAKIYTEEKQAALLAMETAIKSVELKYSDLIAAATLQEKTSDAVKSRIEAFYEKWKEEYREFNGHDPSLPLWTYLPAKFDAVATYIKHVIHGDDTSTNRKKFSYSHDKGNLNVHHDYLDVVYPSLGVK